MTTLQNESGFELLNSYKTAYVAVRNEDDNTWSEFVKRSVEVNNNNDGDDEDLEFTVEDAVRIMIQSAGAKVIKHNTETAVDYVLVVALDEADAEIEAQKFLDGLDDTDKYIYEAGAAYETSDKFVYNVRYNYTLK